MEEERILNIHQSQQFERGVYVLALAICLVLFIAAIGKLFYPIEYFKFFDRAVSVIEFMGIILIFRLRSQPLLWANLVFLFALWLGYAFFWHCVELPCGCMGTKLKLPTQFALALDGIFLLLSAAVASILGMRWQVILLIMIGAGTFAWSGFGFAEWIYENYVLTAS